MSNTVSGVLCLLAAMALGVLMIVIGFRMNKYEIENRTSGGVVQFKSAWAAMVHRGVKNNLRFLFGLPGLLLLAAAMIFFVNADAENKRREAAPAHAEAPAKHKPRKSAAA